MYNAFYGFAESPFEATPDPKFFYLTSGHREALSSMLKGIANRKGFVSLTGEVGTGKTTLVRVLLDRLDGSVKAAFILHPCATFEELLRNILFELGLEAGGRDDEVLLSRLNEYLLQKPAQDEDLIVVIDEAQNLPIDVMAELGKLEKRAPGISNRLQIIFVGQPEFEHRLNSPGLRLFNEKIETRCQIRSLTNEESMEYIDHRLKAAGSSCSRVFTSDAIPRVIDYVKGIPRVINILCDNAFLMGHALSKKRIDVGIILQVIGEIEGPKTKNSVPGKILTSVKGIVWRPFRVHSFHKKTALFILLFICVGGVTLLTYGFLLRKPVLTGSIDPIMPYRMTADASFMRPPSQTEEASTLPPQNRSRNSDPQGLLLRIPQPSPSAPRSSEYKKGIVTEIAVEKGQNISFLVQKYYHRVNLTLAELILDLNPGINNVHLIEIDQIIKIPKITKELLLYHSADGSYKLHVGTFWDPDFVRPYKEEPALSGKRIEVVPRKVSPKDIWYRVVVGDFDNEKDALKAINLLEEKKLLPLLGGDPKK